MSHTKKHKPHRCKNHPRVVARGRCARCGAWICRACAALTNGQFLCADSCGPVLSSEPPRLAPAPMTTSVRLPPTSTMTIAATTFALCLLVLSLWLLRANTELRYEVDRLRQQRMDLIGSIRENNQEIADLDARLTPNPEVTTPLPQPKRTPSALAPEPIVLSTGLPASFDNGPTDKMLVALTFDGGSHDNAAAEILDTLASRNVKATMFISGEFIRKFPDLILRIVGEGHEVGNHTYSHPHLTAWASDQTHTTLASVSPGMLAQELRRTDDTFRKLTGRPLLPLWRAPYGEKNRQICLWAQSAGYLHIGWGQGRTWRQNLDSNDWIPNEEAAGYHAPQEVLDKIFARATAEPYGIRGGIILMHLGTERTRRGQQVHLILGQMIDRLREMGYAFVTVSKMLEAAGMDVSVLTVNKEGGIGK